MGRVDEIKELVNQFNIEKWQIGNEIQYIEDRRTLLALFVKNRRANNDYSSENQEQINLLRQKIVDLGEKSQNFQRAIDTKNIVLKDQVCEIVSKYLAEELVELKKTTNQKEYEKDVYQQIEKYCDTDQQIEQIEKIISVEKKEKLIYSKQCKLNKAVRKVKCNQFNYAIDILEELYPSDIVAEEINIAEFIDIEEQEIITNEEESIQPIEEVAKEISNIIVKFEKSELVYKATLNNGEEVNFRPSRENHVNKKDFVSKLKTELINYVIRAHKILDNSVVRYVDPNVCQLLQKVADQERLNYYDLVYDYAMAFSSEEEVRTAKVPIILYNLYYIKESNLSLIERARLIKSSKEAQRKANFDVMGYNIPVLRVEYFLRRIFGLSKLKEISGEKIS